MIRYINHTPAAVDGPCKYLYEDEVDVVFGLKSCRISGDVNHCDECPYRSPAYITYR